MIYTYNYYDAQSFKNSIHSYADLSSKKNQISSYETKCGNISNTASHLISTASQKLSSLTRAISEMRSKADHEKSQKQKLEKELKQVENDLRELELKKNNLQRQLAEAKRHLNNRTYAPQTEKNSYENLLLKIEAEIHKTEQEISSTLGKKSSLKNETEEIDAVIQSLNEEIESTEEKKEEISGAIAQASEISNTCAKVQDEINYAYTQVEMIEKSLENTLDEIENSVSLAMSAAEEFYFVDIVRNNHASPENKYRGFDCVHFTVDDTAIDEYRQLLKEYNCFFEERELSLRKLFESFSWRDNIYHMTSINVEENKKIVFSVTSDLKDTLSGIERMLSALSEYTRWA